MSRNYYSEINLHIVWHTKSSLPLLAQPIERATHDYLRQRIVNSPGSFVHSIGGTDNHVHLAVTIPPTLQIADFIGQLKGSSSHEINRKYGDFQKKLQWQAGYGVVSFGKKDLPWVINYIKNQKEHHSKGDVYDRLERIEFAHVGSHQREDP